MTTRTLNIAYWAVTGLFSAFMLFSSIPNLMSSPESMQFVKDHLGYPGYIVPFLGAAKIAGAIALLVPGFRRLKEWAYAGFFFDLIGAFYSILMVDGFQPPMAFMLLFFAVLFGSWYLWHKRLSGA